MKAILHIGTEKTGTTTIQEFLTRNRSVFREHGLHYLTSAGLPNNRWVPSACMSKDRADDFFQGIGATNPVERERRTEAFRRAFGEEMESLPTDVRTVLISSEHLHSRLVLQSEVDAVGELLAPHFEEVSIICYLRPQVEMCVSLYSTAIKAGAAPDFDEFLEECGVDNIYYNYADMLEMWRGRFGPDALHIRIFDRREMYRGDLLQDLMYQICEDLADVVNFDVGVANESLSVWGQAFGKAINRAFAGSSEDSTYVRRQALDTVSMLLAGTGQRPSSERASEIQDAFAECNERVRRDFFPDRPALFDYHPKAASSLVPAPGEEVVDALAEVIKVVWIGSAGKTLPDSYAPILRDVSIAIESSSPGFAYQLMRLAGAIRPNGPLIRGKLKQYEQISRDGGPAKGPDT